MAETQKEVVMVQIIVPVENDEQAMLIKKSINTVFADNPLVRIDFRIMKMPVSNPNGS